MAQVNKSNLGFLGEDYQYKLIHEFMSNHSFFEDLYPIVDQNMFTNANLRIVVGAIKNFYEKEGHVPSYSSLEVELRNKAVTDIEVETYLAVIGRVKDIGDEASDRVEELATRFFRQQNMIRVANEILRVVGDGKTDKYDECVALLNDAVTNGTHNDFGETLFDHLSETLSDDYRTPIPTGIDKIDETLEGGLGKGELGVIIGPTSFGKTSLTTAMASHAALTGHKTLQIVFEDRVKQIRRKHIGRLTGIEAKDLSKPDNIDFVKETLARFEDETPIKENLRIVRFPSGEKTARYIERYIKRLSNSGFKPELVVIDYFECVEPEKGSGDENEFSKEGRTMRRFEAMAGELDIALWIPSQGTKDSINLDLVTMDKIGGSVKKAQIAHVIMSIARTVDDISNNKATIAILKNRAGKSGKVFNNVDFNNGTCIISTDHVDELDNMFEYKQRKSEELLNIQKMCLEQSKNKNK